MGLVSTKYTNRKGDKIIRVIHDQHTQTDNTLSTITNGSSKECNHHISPHRHIQASPVFSSHFNNYRNISNSNGDLSSYDRMITRNDTYRKSSSSIIENVSHHEHRAFTRVQSSLAIHDNEYSYKEAERSTSIPVDLFLIDISNEKISIDESISMNIRHLLMNMPDNSDAQPLLSIHTETSSKATRIHENLLDYVPNVCERYPNITVGPDQTTHNTLHASLPL
ncbi:unnamed protein product [Rotaria magnacalcarata]|uniref:Uncharacterized protein n=1 Tax=Rotaria magnacalcarata TaxID=392030 RepID=A0A816R6H0_9BILA|nr:unnamed protein product [Rotaria magnacalcarata]CAF1427112.1 unnamed protein product [Rotaria magnacalcarata]CAF2071065.1 unnamed protein product [Rotaria magnacalcarata]CAF2076450.1 unnamed protein product [Rotaria magnacalcarata]CAF2076739.1 unnamed protein product [Rotaria magnacalcarata]